MSKRVKVPLRATGSRFFFFMTRNGKHHDNHEQQKEANSEENDRIRLYLARSQGYGQVKRLNINVLY